MDLSIIIPNRNSPFTAKTIEDVLKNAGVDIEVIVNVDEKWPEPLSEDGRVHYIHPASPIGLRQGINNCVAMAKGKYILKCDDHVAFGENFGKILIENHLEDNWIQIPRRYALNVEEWKIEERTDNKYPINYMYIDFPRKGKDHDDGMHGVPWKRDRTEEIDDTPSMQGSCYFMTRNYFLNVLGGLKEEGYGQFAQESQEIGFKTWLGGGAIKVNKKTWYAHLHKGRRYGRMYRFPGGTVEASSWSADHWLNNREPDMVHKFEWFINTKFPGMPSWPSDWEKQIKEMGWIS
ncbi:MAG TPA: glycosyltransferase [Thermodesulfobacteriota bacterium]|nr:glycosyltransferase [Thermodesulfobacteriota bacterium]